MDNRAINFNREPKQFSTGKSGTNRISTSNKLVAMQEAKERVESKMVDIVDYKILRKSGALSK